jgi:hypothetical protein
MLVIVHSREDRVRQSLFGVVGKVGDKLGGRRHGSRHLEVEREFLIGDRAPAESVAPPID